MKRTLNVLGVALVAIGIAAFATNAQADVVVDEISGDVTGVGQNAWLCLGDGVTYRGHSSAAVKTVGNERVHCHSA